MTAEEARKLNKENLGNSINRINERIKLEAEQGSTSFKKRKSHLSDEVVQYLKDNGFEVSDCDFYYVISW